ncbi:hypothetical protein [Streptomyces hawaiiensis]|uniref:hypothetical protein n=1 Tax=Streptomyces hawaiiensis TaxID=67305 RepID=UPI003662726C
MASRTWIVEHPGWSAATVIARPPVPNQAQLGGQRDAGVGLGHRRRGTDQRR